MKFHQKLFVLLAIFMASPSITFSQEIISKVNVNVTDTSDIDRLIGLGFDIDHPEFTSENSIAIFVDQVQLAELRRQQFTFDILIADFDAYYAEMLQNDSVNIPSMTRSSDVADGFDLGSMGGFYTFSEVEAKLDEMKINYPNLVSTKMSIGTSFEGRPIWMVKISDNPEIDEPEPTAYFDALHHAREPLSMASTINYMFWLLENYETDAAVQYLVDNREIYFVPVVNPDGYAYNELTDPDGGGFWRKNRRADPGGCFGVDLNRNYSFGYANGGGCSSNDPCSGTYHGSGAFSEPESSAVRDFVDLIEPRMAFSTHSTAGSVLMPYGFEPTPPEFSIYAEFASAFLSENDYLYGVTFQMLGYFSCGTTRDYLHSEGIYGYTPEIAGQGFWPPPSTIFDLVDDTVRMFYYQSWTSGGYIDVQSHTQIGDALVGGSFELVVEVKNVGVGADAQTVSVGLEASDPDVQVPTSIGYGTVAARSRKDNAGTPFTITIDPGFIGTSFTLTVNTFQDGVLNETIDIPIIVGERTVLFSDNAESGDDAWIAGGNGMSWGIIADDSYGGNFSFGDSDGGNGVNDTNNFFELDQSFDFNGLTSPVVSFTSKQSIESSDDARFQISTDGGTNWENLRSYSFNKDWHTELFLLNDYIGFGDVRFRFTMETDNFKPGDGLYFDDFVVADYDVEILTGSEAINTSEVKIHPNPFTDGFTIELSNELLSSVSEIVIYDVSGRRIQLDYEQGPSSVRVLKTKQLSSGIYFLKLEGPDRSVLLTKKMIKN